MKLNGGTGRSTLIARIGAALVVSGLLLSGCAAATTDSAETGLPDPTATQDESPTASVEAPTPEEPAAEESAADEADDQETEDANEGPAPATATATLEGESFTFSPSTCMITQEDILVEAGGKNEETGDPAFLSIDMNLGDQTTGEIRIELGTDNPFESTDDFYTAFFGDGYEGTIDAKFPQASFTGIFHVSGGDVLSTGDVEVTCG